MQFEREEIRVASREVRKVTEPAVAGESVWAERRVWGGAEWRVGEHRGTEPWGVRPVRQGPGQVRPHRSPGLSSGWNGGPGGF